MDVAGHPLAAGVLGSSSEMIKHTEEPLTSLLSELGKNKLAQLIHRQLLGKPGTDTVGMGSCLV